MRSNAGFTLIEMMIVLAIIGILAAIAYPSYTDYVKRARRSDAVALLTNVQLLQEKWRANHTTYGSAAQLGITSTASDQGFYTLSISGVAANTYTATAAPAAEQIGDDCGTFAVNQNGELTSGSYASATCWNIH